MRATIIDGDVAFPPTSGKRLRTLHLMEQLARRHDITYIARSDERDSSAAARYFKARDINPVLVYAPLPRKAGPAFFGRLLGNLVSPVPYSVQSHVLAAMREAVQASARAGRPDVWQIEWLGYRYCLDATQQPVVLQAHNVETTLWRRYGSAETSRAKRLYIADQRRKFETFERAAFRAATHVIAVSDDDRLEAHRMFGQDLAITVVPNGVDCAAYQATERHQGPPTILFLGALDWRPNIDGLDFLLGPISEQLRARGIAYRLMVVGRSPSPALRRRLSQHPEVVLHADVPDVRPFLAQSTVMAVPLRIGGGTRLKILEGLAAGLPIVSTSIGAEGLPITDGVHLDLADNADSFAGKLAAQLAGQTGSEAADSIALRRSFAAQFDWAHVADRLDAVWRDVATHRTPTTRAA